MYTLHTNEGKYLVTCDPSKLMYRYIRAKLAQGYKYGDILFCWGNAQVLHKADGLVEAQELKAAVAKAKG